MRSRATTRKADLSSNSNEQTSEGSVASKSKKKKPRSKTVDKDSKVKNVVIPFIEVPVAIDLWYQRMTSRYPLPYQGTLKVLTYSCNKITMTQVQISRQSGNGSFSSISHQMMI